MYKILIVDDEKMIRLGMKKALPWENLEIGRVYTASSGEEALGIIKEEKPEIMISDIQMSEMNGLALIDEARKISSDIRVIVLTGHDNFEYARQSVRLTVQDFFLKPIEESELAKAVSKQVSYLNNLKIKEKNSGLLRRTQGTAEQAKLEHHMRNLAHKREDLNQILDELKEYYHIDVELDLKLMLINPALYMNQQIEDKNFQMMTLKNVCMSMVDAQEKGITFLDDDGTIAVAWFDTENADVGFHDIKELSDILEDEAGVRPQMVVGSTVHGFSDLFISYNDARYLLDDEKDEIHDIIHTAGAQNKEDAFKNIYEHLKGVMRENSGNADYVMKVFNTFAEAAQAYNLSTSAMRVSCFELACALYFSCLQNSGCFAEEKLDSLSKSLISTDRRETLEATRAFIVRLLGKGEENVHDIITKAKRYIDEHLTEEFSVSNIAEELYVTPSYFSRLFKREAKEGCNEYIVRKRIEKAKALLETTGIKTGKIALMVGYHDTHYFSLAFKRYTGKSPTQYREWALLSRKTKT